MMRQITNALMPTPRNIAQAHSKSNAWTAIYQPKVLARKLSVKKLAPKAIETRGGTRPTVATGELGHLPHFAGASIVSHWREGAKSRSSLLAPVRGDR